MKVLIYSMVFSVLFAGFIWRSHYRRTLRGCRGGQCQQQVIHWANEK